MTRNNIPNRGRNINLPPLPPLPVIAQQAAQGTVEGVGKTFNGVAVACQIIFIPLVPLALGFFIDGSVRGKAAATLSEKLAYFEEQEAKNPTKSTQRTLVETTVGSGSVKLSPSKKNIKHEGIDGISSQGTVIRHGVSTLQERITTMQSSAVKTNAPCVRGQYQTARTQNGTLNPAQFLPAELTAAAACIQRTHAAELQRQNVNITDVANTYNNQNMAGALWVTTAVGILAWHVVGKPMLQRWQER